MDFDTALGQAWTDHADDSRSVATRWPALRALVTDEPQLERLIGLTMHVHGPHLGDWAGGVAAFAALRALAAYRDDGASGAAVRRCLAGLALCAGMAPDVTVALTASDTIRAHAMAAESLAMVEPARALQMLEQALSQAAHSGLPDTDPMHRTLGAAGNNIAATLEEKRDRSADERALMVRAAQAARQHWERAGTWLEVERAEYRLAMSWLQAGDLARARTHAQACLDIVEANAGAALERFFGWEARGAVARAAGDRADHALAIERARAAFDELTADDQGWCRASLDKLVSAAVPA